MNELSQHQPKVFPRGRQKRMNPPAFAQLVKALMDTERGLTTKELCELTGLVETTVRYYCKSMVTAEVAHISGWKEDVLGRDIDPRYKLGMGINVPRRLKGTNHKRDLRRARDRALRVALEANQQI